MMHAVVPTIVRKPSANQEGLSVPCTPAIRHSEYLALAVASIEKELLSKVHPTLGPATITGIALFCQD